MGEITSATAHVDVQWVVAILVGLVVFFGGIFIRDLKKCIDDHTERLRHIEINYLTKVEFDKFEKAVFNKLDRIEVGVTECRINGAVRVAVTTPPAQVPSATIGVSCHES